MDALDDLVHHLALLLDLLLRVAKLLAAVVDLLLQYFALVFIHGLLYLVLVALGPNGSNALLLHLIFDRLDALLLAGGQQYLLLVLRGPFLIEVSHPKHGF